MHAPHPDPFYNGLLLIFFAAWIGLIWFFGRGCWGRAQTQQIIDRVRRHARLHQFLDRHHGKFRAAMHYVEFGILPAIVYEIFSFVRGELSFSWNDGQAATTAALSILAALLDELNQRRSSTRQFRREDFLHSICGIMLALCCIRYMAMP